MSNTTFAKSVDAFVVSQNKGASAFGLLVTFAHELMTSGVVGKAEVVLKNTLDVEEKTYRAEHPKVTEMPVAYRSAKSVVVNAVKHGVPLMDEAGKPMGKSALEKLTKEAKGEGKTPAEKFAIAINTATTVFADVDTLEDVRKCKALLAMLVDSVVKAEAAAIAAAAEAK